MPEVSQAEAKKDVRPSALIARTGTRVSRVMSPFFSEIMDMIFSELLAVRYTV